MLHVPTSDAPPDRLEITSAADDVAVVALIGDHDLGRYESLKVTLARAAVRSPNVIVDLSGCAFVDLTTLRLLLHAHDVITRDGGGFALVITPEPGPVSRLAELAHLAEMLLIQPSLEAALASFESQAI